MNVRPESLKGKIGTLGEEDVQGNLWSSRNRGKM